MYNFIETSIMNNIAIALFVVEIFTYDHIITELLMTVPLITFESAIAGLLNISLKRIYKFEHENVIKYCIALYADMDNPSEYKVKPDFTETLEDYLEINSSLK